MKLNEKMKNLLSTLLRFGLSACLLLYLFKKIDWEETVDVVGTADSTFIFYAFVLFIIINFFILLRWFIFIKALKLEVSFLNVTRYFFIGLFGNLFLPSAIGGDVIKAIGLCRYSSQKPKVVASVLLDRLSGFAAIVIVATAAFIGGFGLIDDLSLVAAILSMAGISTIMAVILFNEKIYSFCCRIFSPFPKIKQALMNVHYDIVLLKDERGAIYKAIGLSGLAQFFLAVTFFLVGKALHQDISLIYCLIFVPMLCVVSSFPSIGGLGFREAGAAYLFAKVGVAAGVAVSISLINFLFMVFIGLMGGLICVVTKSPEATQDPAVESVSINNNI